jgi:hypothetical protein
VCVWLRALQTEGKTENTGYLELRMGARAHACVYRDKTVIGSKGGG